MGLDANGAAGPDGIPPNNVITRSINTFPSSWLVGNIQPIPKKGMHSDPQKLSTNIATHVNTAEKSWKRYSRLRLFRDVLHLH